MEVEKQQDSRRGVLCYSLPNGWKLELVDEASLPEEVTTSLNTESKDGEKDGRVVVCTLKNFTGTIVMVPTTSQPLPSPQQISASTSPSSLEGEAKILNTGLGLDDSASESLSGSTKSRALSVQTSPASEATGKGGEDSERSRQQELGEIEAVLQGTSETAAPSPESQSSALSQTKESLNRRRRHHQQQSPAALSSVASPTSQVTHDASSITRSSITAAPNSTTTTPASNGSGGSRWGVFFRVDQARRSFLPSPMRRAREAARSNNTAAATPTAAAASSSSTTPAPYQPPPTRLHQLCAESLTSSQNSTTAHVRCLEEALAQQPQAVKTLDARGRTTLHILGDNDTWFATNPLLASRFGLSLIQANPEAITQLDGSSRMPFIPLLEDWCIWIYQTHENEKKSAASKNVKSSLLSRTPERGASGASGARDSLVNSTLTTAGRGIVEGANTLLTTTVEYIRTAAAGGGDDLESNQHHGASTGTFGGSLARPEMAKSANFYPSVELWEEVEFCFGMLSLELDELGGKNGGLHQTIDGRKLQKLDLQARSDLVSHLIEVIPTILKTVLLIDDRETRRRLFKMPIFRRLLLVPASVGPWLTHMLHRKGIPAKRAVDYLELVSQTTVEDYVGDFRTVLQPDIAEFEKTKNSVFEAMEGLQSTITSLVVLENRDVDRAAACSAVWHIMDRNLARPFVVGLLLIDFVLHVTLMLAVREDVGLDSGSTVASLSNVPTSVALFICTHYIVRKIAEAMSLFNLSWTVFRSYFANIWTILDFTTIVATLFAVSWDEGHPNQYKNGFNAFVVGLLWLKMLGFLKVVNKHMSTFIMAVFQILRDLKYFAIVLVVVVCQMGDMMSIAVGTKDNGNFCYSTDVEGDTTIEDFCSEERVDAYLRVWGLLLGDFDLDSYKETDGLTALFLIFTIVGVVILLNVLIAVISDSYERAKIRSAKLFGRARVTFVAQNEALEVFLRPGTDPLEMFNLDNFDSPRKAIVCGMHVFRWLVLLTLIATAMFAEVFLVSRAIAAVKAGDEGGFFFVVLAVILAALLSAALWIVVVFMLEGVSSYFSPSLANFFVLCNKCSQHIVELVASRVFGVRTKTDVPNGTFDDSDDLEEEWNGRMDHIEQIMARALLQTRESIHSEIEGLERRLREQQALLANTNAGF